MLQKERAFDFPPEALERARAGVCTARQVQVLDLVARHGWSYRQAGDFLGLAESTIRGHLDRAAYRLGRQAPVEVPVVTSCGRCGSRWSGPLVEARAAFQAHACGGRPGRA